MEVDEPARQSGKATSRLLAMKSRLRERQKEEGARLAKLPDVQVWHKVSDEKPGATVLAELARGDSATPGLVEQRFGEGRTMALLAGDFWRFGMRRADSQTDDLAQSWRQIARRLTSDTHGRIIAEIIPPTESGEPHRVEISLLDRAFAPLDNASVQVTVTPPAQAGNAAEPITMTAVADSHQRGHYAVEFWCKADGGYTCQIDAKESDATPLDPLVVGWVAEPEAAEFARVEPDRALLESLAKRSGGEVVSLERLDAFVSRLASRRFPVTETRIEPLWHRPWLVIGAIGCLCVEWGLRRWKGLA